MSALENLTVCITTYHRPDRLANALLSVRDAGIIRVAVAAPEADQKTLETLESAKAMGWASFDVSTTKYDVGCNNSWMLAAYAARTKRIILLHDDDSLHPDFGKAYETIIAPCLDKRDAGFASWDAEIKFDDGKTEACPYWQGDRPVVVPSRQLTDLILSPTCLTHSPVISVLNRTVLIRACKEASENLVTTHSIERPGMLLGTELLVYLRHCEMFKRWLHVPQVLSYYGSHEGSGTIQAQGKDETERLVKGYNLARNLGRLPRPIPRPRIILVHSVYTPKDPEERKVQELAQESWQFHFATGEMIDLPMVTSSMPKIREVLDYACTVALPEDIVVYANADAGLTTHAVERLIAGIDKGRGVTCCGNRALDDGHERFYKSITNLKPTSGTEIVAVMPSWWRMHREKMPDMYIGREAWDTCFNALAEDWADGPADVRTDPDHWQNSRAHTDNVCWHKPHFSQWQTDRTGLQIETQKHNRELAKAFFEARQDAGMLAMLK